MPPERRHTAAAVIAPDRDLPALLRQGAAELGLALDATTERQLLALVGLLRKWSAVYNLTALRDPAQMLIQHLLDSLAIVPVLRRHVTLEHATVADIGSGAGFPGLPIAIVEPLAHIVSIEPVGKKTAFQRQVCAELALTNIEIETTRAETLSRPCEVVTSRAFASLVDFIDAAAGLTGPTTVLAAMKGQRTEIDAEVAALPADCRVTIEPIRVPFLDAERHLVLIRRVNASARTP
jgi:16S rRNA (guanine527-N7)-methyltransferase